MAIQTSSPDGDAVEVVLGLTDHGCFFVRASDDASCQVFLEDIVHRSDDKLLEFFTVQGASVERILALAENEPAIDDARLVREGENGNVFQFIVSGPCVTSTLAETGALTRSVWAVRGQGRVVADVPPHVEVRAVVEAFQSRHPESELVARRTHNGSIRVRTEQGARVTLTDRLTEKQLEVLRIAYLSGYFDWPRESSATECAEALGISQPTFSQHVRTAQYRLFETLFETETPH